MPRPFPIFILRGAPLVKNTTFMGICVDNPRRFKAYTPIGTIFALSRLAIAWAMSSTGGFIIKVQKKINTRSREKLNFSTPKEEFFKLCV